MTHELLDRFRRELGMLGQQRPLVRMLRQHLHRGGQLVAGGVGARVEQDGDEVDQLVVGEPVAVVFGADELGDQVVAEVRRRRAIKSSR